MQTERNAWKMLAGEMSGVFKQGFHLSTEKESPRRLFLIISIGTLLMAATFYSLPGFFQIKNNNSSLQALAVSAIGKNTKNTTPLLNCKNEAEGVDSSLPTTSKLSTSIKSSTLGLTQELQKSKRIESDKSIKALTPLLEARKKYLAEAIQKNPDIVLDTLSTLKTDARSALVSVTENCVEEEVTLEGSLEVTHIDNFPSSKNDNTEKSDTTYILATNDGQHIELHPARGNGITKDLLESRTKVRVRGMLLDNQLVFDGTRSIKDGTKKNDLGGGIDVISQPGNPPVLGGRKVLVVLLDNGTPPADYSPAIANDVFFGSIPNYSLDSFYNENSYGKVTITGDVIGWYHAASLPCDVNYALSQVINQVDPDVDFSQYSHLVVVSPLSCWMGGASTIGRVNHSTNEGTISIGISVIHSYYGDQLSVVAHEVGHQFGNNHAWFGSDEYGDRFNIMGYSFASAHMSAQFKEAMGWFDPSNILTPSLNGTYTLSPYESTTTNLQVLKIPTTPSNYLYVEYRQPLGEDSDIGTVYATNIFNGATLHMNNYLLDATPPPDIMTTALLPGETYRDSQSGMELRVISQTPSGLDVQVTLGKTDFTLPTVSINSPTTNSTVSGTINITVDASDASGIKQVQFSLAGGNPPFATDTTLPYEATLDTTTLLDGSNYILVIAEDLAGDSYGAPNNKGIGGVSINISNTIDTTPPTVSLVTPSEGDTLIYFTRISANASDNVSLASVQFTLDGSPLDSLIIISPPSPSTTVEYWWDPNSVPKGSTHTIGAIAEDAHGNQATAPLITITAGDNVPPSIPTNLSATPASQTLIDLNWSPSTDNVGVSGYQIFKDGTPIAMWNQTSFQVVGLNPGTTYSFTVKAFDSSLNFSSESLSVSTTTLSGDTIAPTVNVSAPVPGANVSSPVTISATASDNVAVTKVEFYVDNVLNSNDTLAPYSTIVTLSPGSHSVFARAYDVAGNLTTSTTVTFTVSDTTAPTVSITQPTSGANVSSPVTISATASDNVAVTKVEFYVDNVLKATDTVAPYSTGVTLTPGSRFTYAKAYDAGGNVSTSSSVSFTVIDTIPPATSITSPTNGSTVLRNRVVTISATASDNVGVTKVEFYINGVLRSTDTTSPYSYGWSVPAQKKVTYTLTAKAYDTAGNVGSSNTVTVTSSN